jgi:predicted TIM-barrel fold metal-dependent hydrolase
MSASELFHDVRNLDCPIIDADAHVQEPPDLWTSRAPRGALERVPRVRETADGDVWEFDGGKRTQALGLTACAGLSFPQYRPSGLRYAEIRPGMYEPGARLRDLDADGIFAQVLYPSVTLAGARTYSDDRELQRFCARAYNEWLAEFCAAGRGRLIGQIVVPTTGISDAVDELKFGIEHGHRGAILSRMPSGGFDLQPEDDAFFGLAQEARIPVAVHIGSFLRENPGSSWPGIEERRYLASAGSSKAGAHTLPVASEFIFSGIFDRFPRLDLVLVESNIGWIPTLLEQVDDMFLRYRWYTKAVEWMPRMPSDVFHQHVWATFMVDTVGLELRHRLNLDHVMWSTDYPHTGSDWPNSRVTLERVFRGIPLAEVRRLVHANAKRLYRLDWIPERRPLPG